MEPQLSNVLVCHVLGHSLHLIYQVETPVLKTEGNNDCQILSSGKFYTSVEY